MELCRDAAGCVSHFVDGMWMFVVPWLALCRDCVYRGLGFLGWLSSRFCFCVTCRVAPAT